MEQSAAAVVVVGAGPVGLVAAVELARRGVPVRIIDKLTAPTTESRAIAVHARSLEMFDRMGLAAELAASGVKATRMEMYAGGRHLAQVEFGQVDSAFPFTVVTAQTETERILAEHLAALGVTVERGTELTGLSQDADAVHLTLARASGQAESADAAWVIGADGARSTVRDLVGTRLAGRHPGASTGL
ncbi:MAG TPA: FAD-dependent monooxygenase [Trebonia sp.]|nr:FAD-dependent monooxygenase [Trebonia sp.]